MDSLEAIRQKIYEIRGQRVMLDFDLAEAYGVETNQLKRQVRRNLERFEGEDFMFEVTREELSRCQIGTLNVKRGQNIKLNRAQFDAISEALAELQAGNREQSHSRKPIGFIVEKETKKNTPPHQPTDK